MIIEGRGRINWERESHEPRVGMYFRRRYGGTYMWPCWIGSPFIIANRLQPFLKHISFMHIFIISTSNIFETIFFSSSSAGLFSIIWQKKKERRKKKKFRRIIQRNWAHAISLNYPSWYIINIICLTRLKLKKKILLIMACMIIFIHTVRRTVGWYYKTVVLKKIAIKLH